MVIKNHLMQLFGQSPFTPLQEHIRIVLDCANEVPGLFQAALDHDMPKVELIRGTINTLESEADDIKNELRAHLPKSMFLPVDRRDLLEILDLQDSIADTAEDIAGMMFVRHMTLPEEMHEPLMDLSLIHI